MWIISIAIAVLDSAVPAVFHELSSAVSRQIASAIHRVCLAIKVPA